MILRNSIAVAAICVAFGAWASEDGAMTYQLFAAKVPHIPLAECPAVIKVQDADCHVAVIDGEIHVMAFAKTADRRLLDVQSESGTPKVGPVEVSRLD